MTSISDEMQDRHAARGVIAADQFRRGDDHPTEAAAIKSLMARSAGMARADGVTDKAQAGFLAMGAILHFLLRLADGNPAHEAQP